MNVVFVYTDLNTTLQARINFGVAFLSGFLKTNGFDTQLVYYTGENDYAHLLQAAQDGETGIVAFSSVSSAFNGASRLAQRLKEDGVGAFLICGGPHTSVFPQGFDEASPFDAICIGYGEYPLLELARALRDGKSIHSIENIHFNTPHGIVRNTLRPFPSELDPFYPEDREIFHAEFRRKGLAAPLADDCPEDFIFARGCPYLCTFCSNHIFRKLGSGKFIVYPSVETAMQTIEQARQLRDFKLVTFHDDILTLDRDWFHEFTTEYARRFAIPFQCNLRAGTFGEREVEALQKANCCMAILGVESGNEHVRNTVLKKKLANEEIIESYDLLHRYGIRTVSQNMVGLPEETFESFYDTVRLNARILPNTPVLSVYFPYPGTQLYDKVVADGYAMRQEDTDDGFVERLSLKLELPDFPGEMIEYAARNFTAMVYMERIFQKLGLGDSTRRAFYATPALYKPTLFLLEKVARPVARTATRTLRRVMRH